MAKALVIHDALRPLSWLIGTWRSVSAKGHFPTIKEFKYTEELTFESVGQPLLNFRAKTHINERPMHHEAGFLRILPNTNKIACINSHNFGLCVIEEGTVGEKELELESTSITRMSFAKDPHVTSLRRQFKMLDEHHMEIRTDMATVNTPEIQNHLKVIYRKQE